MRRLKLDDYDVRVLIKGLRQTIKQLPADMINQACDFTIKLIDVCEKMKPGRRQWFRFSQEEKRIIVRSLVSWRNQVIDAGDDVAIEVINEYLLKFAG